MAGATGYSYGDLSNREDLSDQIKDIDVLETYVTSKSATVQVTNKVHSWVNDPMETVSTQAGTAEGADTTYAATNPTLGTNTTQIIEYGVLTTKTNQNTDHAGFKDKFAREKLKKMKAWKNQLELSVVSGSLVSGTGTAARTMKGIAKFATSNTTQVTSVSLTSDLVNLYLGVGYDLGAAYDKILVGKTLKQRISSFTVGNTRNVSAQDAVLVGRVDEYDSDFGRVEIVKHRYVNTAAAANLGFLAIQSDVIRVGVMDSVHYEDRPASGYYIAGAVVGEYTVEVGNEKGVCFVSGLL